MYHKILFNKILVIGIIILFVGVSFSPAMCGVSFKSNKNEVKNENQETLPLTFYMFDKVGMKQQGVLLPKVIAENISYIFRELEYRFISDPWSDDTLSLQVDFVDMLDLYGLIPEGLSKSYVLSLLNPPWIKFLQRILSLTSKTPFLRGSVLNFLGDYFNVDEDDEGSLLCDDQDFITKYVLLCNVASAGLGIPFPFFMLPRPRGFAAWAASDASTYVGSLLQAESFLASGGQQALALGFVGVGLSVYLGLFGYALIGYAAFLIIRAEKIVDVGPPNEAPVVSNEYPVDGAVDVPVSLSELSFRISDKEGDRMSYSVSTSPDIGSGSGSLKKDGVYSVPVSGLEHNKGYSWTVEVSDGKDTTVKEFSFFTEMLPFDPFDEGWSYRKKITIDHDKVTGDLVGFPVLVSIVDGDLRDKAQSDGDDVLFMDGDGEANQLFHEIEFYNGYSGELVAWVNIPSVSSNSDTSFYVYYGNPNSPNQEYSSKVWDSNFLRVYHLNDDDTSKAVKDSTKNNKHGTKKSNNEPSQDYGIISYSQHFDNNDDKIELPSLHANQYTIEGWFNRDTVWNESSTDWEFIYSALDQNPDTYVFFHEEFDGRLSYRHAGPFNDLLTIIDKWSLNTWYYFTATYDGSIKRFYINGYEENSDSYAGGRLRSGHFHLIGSYHTNTGYYPTYGVIDGKIDEFRISNIARSSSWVTSSYNTMHDPLSFMTFGPEETAP